MTSVYGKGLTGLLKKGWDQIPGVIGGNVMGLIGLGVGMYACFGLYDPNSTPRYKMDYIVYRPDDPRVEKPLRRW